jgi:phospholipid transport system substrate-binding protein
MPEPARNFFYFAYRRVLMSTSRIRCYALGMIILLLLTVQAGISQAASPLEALKIPIENVLSLLKDPKYKNPDQRQQQRDKILLITRQLFDFTEMSKRALARNWKSFSSQEQLQFADVFADHLSNSYMDKIQGEYKDETIVFLDQETVSDGKALVKTKIQRQTKDIPVDYSMYSIDNQWRVYDVNIEGVSLIKNYRTQFDQILVKESPAQLIERLKKKVELKIGN